MTVIISWEVGAAKCSVEGSVDEVLAVYHGMERPADKHVTKNEWTTWNGGDCPVGAGVKVEARLKNGTFTMAMSFNLVWAHWGTAGDIVAYRKVS